MSMLVIPFTEKLFDDRGRQIASAHVYGGDYLEVIVHYLDGSPRAVGNWILEDGFLCPADRMVIDGTWLQGVSEQLNMYAVQHPEKLRLLL